MLIEINPDLRLFDVKLFLDFSRVLITPHIIFEFFIFAVNVDDAVDDIMRQFKGVSGSFIQKAVGSSSPITEGSTPAAWNWSWNAVEIDNSISKQIAAENALNSDNEEGEKEANIDHENIDSEIAEDNGWHSENELSSKDYSQQVINHSKEPNNLDLDRKNDTVIEGRVGKDVLATNFTLTPDNLEDPVGVPPEVCVVSWFAFFFVSARHSLIVG